MIMMAGQYGIPLSEFWLMCGRELQKVMEGVDLHNRMSWEQTRILAYFILNKDVKQSKQIKLEKVIPFHWDRKRTRLPTAQESKALIEKWSRFKKIREITPDGISKSKPII